MNMCCCKVQIKSVTIGNTPPAPFPLCPEQKCDVSVRANWWGQNSSLFPQEMSHRERGHQLWASHNCVPLQCVRVSRKVKACQGVLASTHALQVTPGSCYLGVKVIQGHKKLHWMLLWTWRSTESPFCEWPCAVDEKVWHKKIHEYIVYIIFIFCFSTLYF